MGFMSRQPFGSKGTKRLSNLSEIQTKKIIKGEIIADGKEKFPAFVETAALS